METPDLTLHRKLTKAKAPRQHIDPLLDYYRKCEANAEDIITASKPEIACRKGCALCCHLRVHARAHEVFAIVEHVERTFTAAERVALLDRLQAHTNAVRQLTIAEHQTRNMACPFLSQGGACLIYEARPFSCRAYHSCSISHCQYSFDNPEDTKASRPSFSKLEYLWNYMGAAGDNAYIKQGYDAQEYEIGEACYMAITTPGKQKRWRHKTAALLYQH